MMIARTPLARRTLLRGVGAALSLPLLDAMTPGRAKAAEAAATARKRLQAMHMPNGMAMKQFFPAQVGEGYEITPILKPLEPYRDHFMVVSNLDHVQAEALGDGAGDHGRSCGTYLTGVHVKKTEGADLMSGVDRGTFWRWDDGQTHDCSSLLHWSTFSGATGAGAPILLQCSSCSSSL